MALQLTIDHNVAEPGATQVNNFNVSTSYSNDEIDRSCLRALRCPNPFAVKTRLREKDKLLDQCFDWILRDPQYIRWQNGKDICLLWIKGGAGKGKTMMSIGLIEALLQRPKWETAVTYFFCQNADYELNTIEAIIKGLIFQLVGQQEPLTKALRDRWDTVHKRFTEDVSSWRGLWTIFMEMIERCQSPRVYVVVDALDECRDEGMADLLKLIVRTGLGQPSKVKWLLTSRPLDSAERELLAGTEQVQVDLELNTQHIARGIQIYISNKVPELERRWGSGSIRRQDIGEELRHRGEDTFLWISLVCKRLEEVEENEALTTIQALPSDLHNFYSGMLTQLCEGDSRIGHGCIRLLRVMLLAHRPLNMREVSNVADLPDDRRYVKAVIDCSAAFIRLRGTYVEFVHQSARDYLARAEPRSLLDSRDQYGHGEMAINCLAHLTRQLKVNLLDLPQWDATREPMQDDVDGVLASLGYAATFWFQHLDSASDQRAVQEALADDGKVEAFLRSRFLEWLECLGLIDQLPRAVEGLETLAAATADVVHSRSRPSLSEFVQDARRFLARHFATVLIWPLQVYSSAMVFSPARSVVRQANIDKIPPWLSKLSAVEEDWTSCIQTLTCHSGWIRAVAFSPDGRYIVSGSENHQTVKIWDVKTGIVEKTLAGPLGWVRAVAFSPDGRYIASGSDKIVKVWDARTGIVEKTLTDHLGCVRAVAFSPDGRYIASGSDDTTVKVWDTRTGAVEKTLAGHSHWVRAVVFSTDGRYIASGSDDRTVKVWDTRTGAVEKTLADHLGRVKAVAFSPDGRYIASGFDDKTVKVWDARTGIVEKTLADHSAKIYTVVFSPDGRYIASGSDDKTVKVWDARTGIVEKTLVGHSDMVHAVVFSPDGRYIASGSDDETVKIWDARTGIVEKTPAGDLDMIKDVAFSPDGRYIVSQSGDATIKVWDARTGIVEKTLASYLATVGNVMIPPYGRGIVLEFDDEAVKVWDIRTWIVEKTLDGHLDRVTAVAFSPDGRYVASGSEDDKTVKIWDARTRIVEKTLAGHLDRVTAMAFSPDGRYITSGSDKIVKVWDARTGIVEKTLTDHLGWVTAVAFSPDGRHIASGSDKTVNIWNTRTGIVEKKLAGHLGWVTAVAFSPDGRYIASGSDDKIIKVWDVSTGAVEKTLAGHLDRVTAVAFSSDGRHIASGSWDETVKLWDTEKALQTSGWLTNIWHKQAEFVEIKTSRSVSQLRFSTNSENLITDSGWYRVGWTASERQSQEGWSSHDLFIQAQWIHCGLRRILYLPADIKILCYDVRGDQLAIGLGNGRVLSLTIDCWHISLSSG